MVEEQKERTLERRKGWQEKEHFFLFLSLFFGCFWSRSQISWSVKNRFCFPNFRSLRCVIIYNVNSIDDIDSRSELIHHGHAIRPFNLYNSNNNTTPSKEMGRDGNRSGSDETGSNSDRTEERKVVILVSFLFVSHSLTVKRT